MLTIAMLLGLRPRPVSERALARERDAKRERLRRLIADISDKPKS